MIDEYQDSNQVQEDIMCAISRACQGHNNMFMVGDVKQSIYRFRLARPELFMGKYETYSTSDSPNQRIDLYDNFRSRQEVVDFVNDVFFKIMAKDLGNVTYDDDAALHYHASYPDSSGNEPEIILCDMKSEDIGEILEEEDDKKKIEALMVAKRIKELLANGQVTDKATGQLRPVRLSDIVILLRSIRDWGDKFAEVEVARLVFGEEDQVPPAAVHQALLARLGVFHLDGLVLVAYPAARAVGLDAKDWFENLAFQLLCLGAGGVALLGGEALVVGNYGLLLNGVARLAVHLRAIVVKLLYSVHYAVIR